MTLFLARFLTVCVPDCPWDGQTIFPEDLR